MPSPDVLAQLPIIYRDGAGGVWKEDAPTDYAFKWDGTRLTVNQDLGGGTWGQVQVTQSDYCSAFIIATNDVRRPIKVVQGQVIYTSLSEAQAGFANEIAGLGEHWTPVIINGNEVKNLIGVAPTSGATQFKVRIRKSR